jgi:DNA-binding transcriptional ArsR family regulator
MSHPAGAVVSAVRSRTLIQPSHVRRPALLQVQQPLYCQVVAVTSPAIDLGFLSRVGKVLADPTRLRVLVALLDGPAYPTDLADAFSTTRANLSNHLSCLRDCGLVTATAEGRRVRYDLADPRLGDALRLLASLDTLGFCDT